MEISKFRKSLENIRGRVEETRETMSAAKSRIRSNTRSLQHHEAARELIREAGRKTQERIQYHISDITSLALDSVFENPYQLKAEFINRRNKIECDLYFERDGERMDPLSASGGGAVDIASFALRIASWSMARPHSRNTIILDEPLKNLSAAYQEKGSEMLKEVSERLGLQFIIVTHDPVLTSYADRVFEVSIRRGVSRVKQV